MKIIFNIKSIEKDSIEDKNPAVYAERCQNELINRNYYKALKELDKAILYSNTSAYKIQKERVIAALLNLPSQEKKKIGVEFYKEGNYADSHFWFELAK